MYDKPFSKSSKFIETVGEKEKSCGGTTSSQQTRWKTMPISFSLDTPNLETSRCQITQWMKMDGCDAIPFLTNSRHGILK